MLTAIFETVHRSVRAASKRPPAGATIEKLRHKERDKAGDSERAARLIQTTLIAPALPNNAASLILIVLPCSERFQLRLTDKTMASAPAIGKVSLGQLA
jgi:hypothetical protein